MYRLTKRKIVFKLDFYNELKNMKPGQRDYIINDCTMFPGVIQVEEQFEFYEDLKTAIDSFNNTIWMNELIFGCWAFVNEIILTEISYDGIIIQEFNQLAYKNSFSEGVKRYGKENQKSD